MRNTSKMRRAMDIPNFINNFLPTKAFHTLGGARVPEAKANAKSD